MPTLAEQPRRRPGPVGASERNEHRRSHPDVRQEDARVDAGDSLSGAFLPGVWQIATYLDYPGGLVDFSHN